MTFKEYREHPALSQSDLKAVIENRLTPINPTIRMLEGSIIDCILYTPEDFEERYWIIENVPKNVTKQVIDDYIQIGILYDPREIALALIENEFQGNWTFATMLKHAEKYQQYFNVMILGKIPITQKDYERYEYAAHSISMSDVWKEVDKGYNQYQVPLFGKVECEGEIVNIKGLLDDLTLNDELKEAIITDCKVTKSKNWLETALSLRYDFQMAFYKELVIQNNPGYTVRCQWLVHNLNDSSTKLYNTQEQDLYFGRHGVKKITAEFYSAKYMGSQEVDLLGWEDAIKIYVQAKQLGLPNFDLETYHTKNIYNQSLYF